MATKKKQAKKKTLSPQGRSRTKGNQRPTTKGKTERFTKKEWFNLYLIFAVIIISISINILTSYVYDYLKEINSPWLFYLACIGAFTLIAIIVITMFLGRQIKEDERKKSKRKSK
jgi:hypothetical protein